MTLPLHLPIDLPILISIEALIVLPTKNRAERINAASHNHNELFLRSFAKP